MSDGKRLMRSRDSYIGGVCAGMADYFDMDAIAVRILAVLIAIVGIGLIIPVYIAFWAVLPLEPERQSAYDIEPDAVLSQAAGGGESVLIPKRVEMLDVTPIGWRVALGLGLVILFAVIAGSITPMLPGVSWWQFWPLALMMGGLVVFIVPVRSRVASIWQMSGIAVTSLGGMLLPMSLGIISWATLPATFVDMWPLLVLACILFGVGVYRSQSPLLLFGALLFTLFCLVAVGLYGIPNDGQAMSLLAPNGRAYLLDSSGFHAPR